MAPKTSKTSTTSFSRVAIASVIATSLVGLAACGDDGPDRALQAERAAALAAEYRAGTTVPEPAEPEPEPEPAEPANSVVTVDATTTTVPAVTPTGVVVPVVALDNSFRPGEITIHVGDEVVWENRGRNEHDILNVESAENGEFDAPGAWGISVEGFQPGAVFAHVFTEPGEFRYYCTIHGDTAAGMVGTIIVTD